MLGNLNLSRLEKFALNFATKVASDTEQMISKTSDNRRSDTTVVMGGHNRPTDLPSSDTRIEGSAYLDSLEKQDEQQTVIDPQFDISERPSFFNGNDLNGYAYLADLLNKYTGAGLTTKESIDMMYQEFMSNTSYQRQVADMRAAGVNPALVYGGNGANGASTPAANSSNNGDFAQLVQMLLLPYQLKEMKANIGLLGSQQAKNQSEAALNAQDLINKRTEGANKELDLQFAKDTYDANVLFSKLRNDYYEGRIHLTDEEIKNAIEQRSVIQQNFKKLVAETATEEERKFLVQAQAAFQRASVYEINVLTPLRAGLIKAQTETEKAVASFNTVQGLIQLDLLKSGYVDYKIEEMLSVIKRNESESAYREAATAMQEIKNKIASGKAINLNNNPIN